MHKLIALCGKPGSGKTTVAEILVSEYGYDIKDDGLPMRQMAMDYLGLTEDQVFTQAGKAEVVMIGQKIMTVREVLGEIGNAFEEKFGEDVIPMMSHSTMISGLKYVMGSVRRNQGRYWKSIGALVIEVVNPLVTDPGYEFDRYNTIFVDRVLLNDGQRMGLEREESLARLRRSVAQVIGA